MVAQVVGELPSRILLFGLLASLLMMTAGCIFYLGSPPPPPDPPEVFVTDPGGNAVPVAVRVLVEGDPARPVADARVSLLHERIQASPATSDGEGIARFWVTSPRQDAFGVEVMKAGWTEETVPDALRVVNGSQMAVERDIPVYHLALSFNETHHWNGPATVQMVGDRTSAERHLEFSDQKDLRDAYALRIDTVTVTIKWENTLASRADFGVFIRGNGDGREEDRTERSDQRTGLLHQGNAREEVTVDRDWFLRVVAPRDPQAYYGIDTGEPVVAPEGIPVEIMVHATFRTPVIEVGEAPIVGAWMLAVALAIGVFARRGRPTA